MPLVRPPSNTLAFVLCHHLQDLMVLAHVEYRIYDRCATKASQMTNLSGSMIE